MCRLNVFTLAVLFLLFAPAVSLQAQPGGKGPQQNPKLKMAEAAANRIAGRFHQSLDFNEIFNAEFVTEPRLRSRALALDPEDKWQQFDLATKEHVYVTVMTALHLWAEYLMVQKEHELPPEIDKQPEPKLLSSRVPQNIAELNQWISELDNVSGIYRKYLPADVFRGAQYRKTLAEGVASAKARRHNVPRVEAGNSKFGIPESVPVYVVRPEAFDYYFVEEKGKMKLFYVNILPNFTLF